MVDTRGRGTVAGMRPDTLDVVAPVPRPAAPEAPTRAGTDAPAARWIGATLLALAAGLAALSVLGPLVPGVVDSAPTACAWRATTSGSSRCSWRCSWSPS